MAGKKGSQSKRSSQQRRQNQQKRQNQQRQKQQRQNQQRQQQQRQKAAQHRNQVHRQQVHRQQQRRRHHRHHHSHGGGGGEIDCDCDCSCCCSCCRLEFVNPYEGNPNVISLFWNSRTHGFNEDDSNLANFASAGYDPEPAKRIVAELNALSKSMNFNDEPSEPNTWLIILFTLLGIFPVIFYALWLQNKNLNYLEAAKNFRDASQPIIFKHNNALAQSSRYYLEAGEFYPFVLGIHLVKENQNEGDPNNPQIMANNPEIMTNNPNMMMNNPNMMASPRIMTNQSGMDHPIMMNGPQMMVAGPQMMMNGPQMMVNGPQMTVNTMMNQGQANIQSYNA